MAKKHFKVVADSFIGMTLIKAEDNKVVEIETDIEKGGMTPGDNLLEVEEEETPDGGKRWVAVAEKAARSTKKAGKAKPVEGEHAVGGDLA
jgi:hypothetical protein